VGGGEGARIQDSVSSLASSLLFSLSSSPEEVGGMCKWMGMVGQYFVRVACRYVKGRVRRSAMGKWVDGLRTSVRERRVKGIVRVRVGSISSD
jgi:hypothetical protein